MYYVISANLHTQKKREFTFYSKCSCFSPFSIARFPLWDQAKTKYDSVATAYFSSVALQQHLFVPVHGVQLLLIRVAPSPLPP